MTKSKYWNIPPLITPEAYSALSKFPPILRQILFNRGYETEAEARAYLNAKVDFNTDPFQMTDMSKAVNRIQYAIEHHEPIVVYGNYDVDGVAATALLVEALGFLNADVRGYIPNRFEEGYGLNNNALDELKSSGINLVITVNCGIRSHSEVLHARKLGLDLIISDHHYPTEGYQPLALAIINPKQKGDQYPDKDLAGVGVAYKIAEALLPSTFNLDSLLDLVALGSVEDHTPLVGENRILVRRGIKQIRQTTRQGLLSLAAISDVKLNTVNTGHIIYSLEPRLNAAGRLREALATFQLLLTKDARRAGQLAQKLNVLNREVQNITGEIQIRAEKAAMRDDPNGYLLFAAHDEFNRGVIDLAASYLTDTYYRPAIVASKGKEETRGSCRSIPEFHITDALDRCADLLVRHGGHAAAAGFTVRNENLSSLVMRLKSIAAEKLSNVDLKPIVTADVEVSLVDVRPELFEKCLKYLEPTGYGNPNAVFVARNVKVKTARAIGADAKHLKLSLEDNDGYTHDAIGFRLGEWQKNMPPRVDILFTYEVNEYNGRIGYQLNLKDLKPASENKFEKEQVVCKEEGKSQFKDGRFLNSRYQIQDELGRGGFGAVYKAWDSNLQKICAIKENLQVNTEAQKQFKREAIMLANLNHPYLVRVTDYFLILNQGQYLVMDYVEGSDLGTLLEDSGKPFPVEQALKWIRQVCDALIYIHNQNPPIIHRDIKPANIRITPQGNAVLVDFGLAKIFDDGVKTTMGARGLTPHFAAPEQYGMGGTDAQSDIYSLGVTLYCLLTYRVPPDSVEIMVGNVEPPPPAKAINQNIPDSISDALQHSMQIRRTDRYKSVGDFKTALLAEQMSSNHLIQRNTYNDDDGGGNDGDLGDYDPHADYLGFWDGGEWFSYNDDD